jgi:hypothetical protein
MCQISLSYERRDENRDDKEEAEGKMELSGQDVHGGDSVFVFRAAAANEPEISYYQRRGQKDEQRPG